MSASAVAYWEKELSEATGRLKSFEEEHDQMNPFLHEQWRQERLRELEVCAAHLHVARQKEAE